jgi:hypothetical protein
MTSWVQTSAPANTAWNSVIISSTGQNWVAALAPTAQTVSGIFVSNDYGSSWNNTYTGQNACYAGQGSCNVVAGSSNGQYLAYLDSSKGIVTSSNYGAKFTQLTNAPVASVIASDSTGAILTVCGSNGIYRSTNRSSRYELFSLTK